MENPKQKIIDRLKEANNILVTVSNNPSVDQLAAAIGATLMFNKMGKHASAVFSGEIPSTIEFLQPDKTIEKTTDSLRDFIISLDKSKADKLRYKVEDKLVKIFITPYRTSIGEKDLEFSQGDFNVDVVLAIGVKKREELDQAITSHGRILHDATVISINISDAGELGSINLVENSSSLCEIIASICDGLKGEFDAQIATALLTGIVSETARFSNEKTSANTMTHSAKLMAAGANQQLVATQLQEKPVIPKHPAKPQEHFDPNKLDELAKNPDSPLPADDQPTAVLPAPIDEDGTLNINHEPPKPSKTLDDIINELGPTDEDGKDRLEQIQIDEQGTLLSAQQIAEQQQREQAKAKADDQLAGQNPPPSAPTSRMILQPPSSMGSSLNPIATGQATQNYDPMQPDPVAPSPADSTSTPPIDSGPPPYEPLPSEPAMPSTPEPTPSTSPSTESSTPQYMANPGPQTLADLEVSVGSTHTNQMGDAMPPAAEHVDAARNAVDSAMNGSAGSADAPLDPITALNANPVDLDMGHTSEAKPPEHSSFDLPPNLVPPTLPVDTTASPGGPATPPPVPPPMMPPNPFPSGPASPSIPPAPFPDEQQEQPPSNPLFPQ